MAKDKDRAINPATAQRKLEKSRALKKSRQQLTTQRNEKLARRNPERIQRQIDELKQLESSGEIKQREKDILADLERDLKAVRKAKEALGQKIPERVERSDRSGGRGGSVLGKRDFNGDRKQSYRHDDESETDEDVRKIPMPEDTPPPVPREHRRYFNKRPEDMQAPIVQAQTTYSAAPQVRDLKKEAVARFVPDVVRRKQEAVSGKGGLVEPEEMDRLEAEGYGKKKQEEGGERGGEEGNGEVDEEAKRLAEEEARFEHEMAMVDADDEGTEEVERRTRRVEIEEVEDEDA